MGIINLTKIHSSLPSPIRLHFPTHIMQMTTVNPNLNVSLNRYQHHQPVFVPNCTYKTQPVQHTVYQPNAPQFAQSNFNCANQMELRNSSFQPGFNFDNEFPAMTTFQPKGNMQNGATTSAPLKHSHSTQFNLPSPHLCPSKSTNGTFDNLRKHRLSFNGHQ